MALPPRVAALAICWLGVSGAVGALGALGVTHRTTPAASPLGAGEPAFEPIGPRQGLPASTLVAVLVDRYGFAWFAGDTGVHRFDGEHVHTFDRDPARRDTLASRSSSALGETRDAIWILSFGGVLQRLDARTGAIRRVDLVRRSDGKRPARGKGIVVDAHDRLWIATDVGLFRHDPAGGAADTVALDGAPTRITALVSSADRRQLFAGTVDGRVFSLDVEEGRPRELASLAALPGAPVVLTAARTGEELWLGTHHGLFRLDLGTLRLDRGRAPAELLDGRIDQIVVGPDGALWLSGTGRLGLYRFDPAGGELRVYRHHPDDPHGLPSDRVTALTLDDRANLWIGLERAGASRLRIAQQGVGLYRGPTADGNSFCAAHELSDGRLLVSLCGSGAAVLDPESGELVDRSAELHRALASPAAALTIHTIVGDGGDGLWLPAANVGLLHWWPGSGKASRLPLVSYTGAPLPDPYMNDALHDASGRVWVGMSLGLASVAAGESTLRLLDPSGEVGKLLTGGVIALAEAGAGKLWLGTTHGLVLYDPATGAARLFTHDDDDPTSLSDSFVFALHVDADGTLWVGTQAGLDRAGAGGGAALRFRRYGVGDGLPDQTIDAVLRDRDGALWVGTHRGVARLDDDGRRFRAMTPADGVPDGAVSWRAARVTSDGSLWFGTAAGLLRLLPQRLHTAAPRPVLLNSYDLGGVTHVNLEGPAVAPLTTGYTEARVRFEVAAFGAGRGLSYRLVGLESRWQPMPPSLSVGYDALRPGRYRFEVRQPARGGGALNSTLLVPLTVTPPPWRSRTAYLLYAVTALAALALLVSIYRTRRRRERRHLAELRHLATYDLLTGLPNRTLFMESLAGAVAEPDVAIALFYVDLDRFKNINDSLGHPFGDRVIVAAVDRLREPLPAGAHLARLGGDEFAVTLEGAGDEAAVAAVAQRLIDAFASPLAVEGSEVVVTLSVGISLLPTHTRDPQTLLRYADVALYHAKDSGRNAFRFFAPEMTARVSRRLALETSLRGALERGELYPVFQPQLDLVSDRIFGAEVLLRWQSPAHGLVSPIEFIPILEDTGLIEPVGRWLLADVVRQIVTWRAAGLPPISFAVNLSVHQLLRGSLATHLTELLAASGLPASALELEVTETALMENAARMAGALGELRKLGIGLAIDDFGTGYSSFASLAHLPVDKLKIDKSFVDGVGQREDADTLCAAIIAMAHNLRLVVVAEGVETELQHERLRTMRCDGAQGYWYARPMPAAELEKLLVEAAAKRSSLA